MSDHFTNSANIVNLFVVVYETYDCWR